MFYRIPLYVEVQVTGDFDPAQLTAAVHNHVEPFILKVIKEFGGFPHTSKDLIDELGPRVAKAAKVRQVKITLCSKIHVIKELGKHE